MLLAFAENVLQSAVYIAEKSIASKIIITKISAKFVAEHYLKQLNSNSKTNQIHQAQSMNPNLLHSTLTSLESRKTAMTSKRYNKKKTPLDPIYICRSCANRKHMPRAEKVWVREGTCDFCFQRTYICQAVDYLPMDATKQH
jgi:hypothetical protein